MMIHHLFYDPNVFQGYSVIWEPFDEKTGIELAQLCKVCVAIFVFLTGYGTMKSFLNDHHREYYDDKKICKRYFRVMSVFWFIYIAAALGSCVGSIFGAEHTIFSVYCKDGVYKGIIYAILDFLGVAHIFETPVFNVTWWYIPYAIFFILITPGLIKASDILKGALIPIAFLFQRFFCPDNSAQIFRYLPVLVLGIYFAKYSIFEKIRFSSFAKNKLDIPVFLILLIFFSYVRQKLGYYDISEAAMAVTICYLVYRCASPVKIINRCLEYLGIFSINIFMLHTFIYYYYFKDFIYSFGNIWGIILVLLLSSLAVSILLEKMKKLFRYDALIDQIEKRTVWMLQKIQHSE